MNLHVDFPVVENVARSDELNTLSPSIIGVFQSMPRQMIIYLKVTMLNKKGTFIEGAVR